MPRGNAHQSKVHYQGKEEDFVIMVDDVQSVQKWKDDKSIPLAQVVSGFKIFVTHKYVYTIDPRRRFEVIDFVVDVVVVVFFMASVCVLMYSYCDA